jgi:hypothetical protein
LRPIKRRASIVGCLTPVSPKRPEPETTRVDRWSWHGAVIMTRTLLVLVLAACGSTVVSEQGLSKACAADADCVAVFLGDQCSNCTCSNDAIAVGSQAAFEREASDARSRCGPLPALACKCPASSAHCSAGACALTTP